MIDCPNVPPLIAACIRTGKASLIELDTVYGVEDMHDLIEIALIEAHNERIVARAAEKKS